MVHWCEALFIFLLFEALVKSLRADVKCLGKY